jgi:hypothetical protein
MKRSYYTDLTDAEWRCLEPHVPGLCASAEAFVYAAMVRLMARRLARA